MARAGAGVMTAWVAGAAQELTSVDPAKVTPGMGGFLVFFALGLASWLLYRSLTTHMRRVDPRYGTGGRRAPGDGGQVGPATGAAPVGRGTPADDGADDGAEDRAEDRGEDRADDSGRRPQPRAGSDERDRGRA